ncbi:class I SAM-dependent methyltransferase, partial [Mycobacterium shinjukuense]
TTPVSARLSKDAIVIVTWNSDPVSPCSDDRLLPLSHLTLAHRGFERYDDFFRFAYHALPTDGVMLLHAVTALHVKQVIERGIPLTMEMAKFIRFIVTEIFPGGRLPMIETVDEHSTKEGFTLTGVQSLQPHFARTLDLWAEALAAHKDEAVTIQSEEVYQRYMRYLTGCAKAFRMGYIDCNQFTLAK